MANDLFKTEQHPSPLKKLANGEKWEVSPEDIPRLVMRYAPFQFPLVSAFEPSGYLELPAGGERVERNSVNPFVAQRPENPAECKMPPAFVQASSDVSRIEEYALEVMESAKELCEDDPAWKLWNEVDGVQAFTRKVWNSDAAVIKHIEEVDAPADVVADLYVKFNYTEVVDPYTTKLRSVEKYPSKSFNWLQTIHTYDPLASAFFPIIAPRDYVTLDFADPSELMLVSKTIVHPDLPDETQNNGFSNGEGPLGSERVVRVAFMYAVKVEPIAENRCRVIAVHWGDLGGNIGKPLYTESAILDFGFDFSKKFLELLRRSQMCTPEGALGSASPNFMADPLANGWVKDQDRVMENVCALAGAR